MYKMRKSLELYEDQFLYNKCSNLIYDPIVYYGDTNKYLHHSIISEYEYFKDSEFKNRYITEYAKIIYDATSISELYTLRDILIQELDKVDKINRDANRRDKESIKYIGFLLSRLTYYDLDREIRDARITTSYDEIRMMVFADIHEK